MGRVILWPMSNAVTTLVRKAALVRKTNLSGKKKVNEGLTDRAWSSLTFRAEVIAIRKTVLKVR